MQAGQYYVGDLCYVLGDRWDEVCSLIIVGHKCLDGVFTLSDGTEFGIFSTAYGDGCYTDQEGREYPVDSGSIGCVLVSSITPGELEKACGNLIDIEWNFTPYESDGLIEIAHISIMTDIVEEDEVQDYWIGEEDDE